MNVTILLKPAANEEGKAASFTIYNVTSAEEASEWLRKLIEKEDYKRLIK